MHEQMDQWAPQMGSMMGGSGMMTGAGSGMMGGSGTGSWMMGPGSHASHHAGDSPGR